MDRLRGCVSGLTRAVCRVRVLSYGETPTSVCCVVACVFV